MANLYLLILVIILIITLWRANVKLYGYLDDWNDKYAIIQNEKTGNRYKVSKEDVMVERETTTKNPIKDKDGRFHIAIELRNARFVASLDKNAKTFTDSKKPK